MIIDIALGILLALFLLATIRVWLPLLLGAVGLVTLVLIALALATIF